VARDSLSRARRALLFALGHAIPAQAEPLIEMARHLRLIEAALNELCPGRP
jgi:hypothetical protein